MDWLWIASICSITNGNNLASFASVQKEVKKSCKNIDKWLK